MEFRNFEWVEWGVWNFAISKAEGRVGGISKVEGRAERNFAISKEWGWVEGNFPISIAGGLGAAGRLRSC